MPLGLASSARGIMGFAPLEHSGHKPVYLVHYTASWLCGQLEVPACA